MGRGRRVAFVVLPDESGHRAAMVTVANRLRQSGLGEPLFVGVADDQDAIEARGHAFSAVATRAYPKGFYEEQKRLERLGKAEGALAGVARAKLFVDEVEAALPNLARMDLGLVVADGVAPVAALFGLRLGIPTVLLHTTFYFRNRALPPLESPRFPRAGGKLTLPDRLMWTQIRLGLFQWSWRVPIARVIAWKHGLTERQLLERFIPNQRFKSFAEMSITLPNLVACPPALDFPHTPPPNVHYVDALVDPSRRTHRFEASRVPEGAKLVYLSMGTQAWLMKRPHAFFRKVFDVVAARPHVHLLISTGRFIDLAPLGELPPNVEIHEHVPQLDVLARADAMITHAGLNSVKECVMEAVPMLCFPVSREQPGNAARVAYHGLGLSLSHSGSTADEIGSALDRVLLDPLFRVRLEHMREAFCAAEARDEVSRIIGEMLSGTRQSDRDGARPHG